MKNTGVWNYFHEMKILVDFCMMEDYNNPREIEGVGSHEKE